MQSKLVRWPKLLIAAVALLFVGVINAQSVRTMFISPEFDWLHSQIVWIHTVTICFFWIGGLAGSRLLKACSTKIALWAGSALVAIGFGLLSVLVGPPIILYIFYGGFAGLGSGIIYNVIISSTLAWFPDRKGMCSGVMLMCLGLGAVMIGKVAEVMFARDALGVRKVYLILGIVSGVAVAVCALGVRMPEPGTQLPDPRAKGLQAGELFEGRDYTTSEMLKRSSFRKFLLYSILIGVAGSVLTLDLIRTVGVKAGLEIRELNLLVSVLASFLVFYDGLGNIIGGFVFDLEGCRKTMIIVNSIMIIALATVFMAIIGGSLRLCIAGLCLTGISRGVLSTVNCSFVGAFYGMKNFSSNFAAVNLMLLPASFIVSRFGWSLYSGAGGLLILIALAAAALFINLRIRRP